MSQADEDGGGGRCELSVAEQGNVDETRPTVGFEEGSAGWWYPI